MTLAAPRLDGRFIDGPLGPLALVSWHPPAGVAVRFGVLHVPAAGDEMNKSRRMVALQARAFARNGGVVGMLDLSGTGDSYGDFGDATWPVWRGDVEAAWTWLARTAPGVPPVLWGLRLGALLAADVAAEQRVAPALLLLWQPVVSGRVFFGQLLRIASTQRITGSGGSGDDAATLRRRLASGSPVEVAGYELNPGLVAGAEAVELAKLSSPQCPVVWRETTSTATPEVSPAARKVQEAWSGSAGIDIAAVSGPSFWASQELAEAPALIEATTEAVLARVAAVDLVR